MTDKLNMIHVIAFHVWVDNTVICIKVLFVGKVQSLHPQNDKSNPLIKSKQQWNVNFFFSTI